MVIYLGGAMLFALLFYVSSGEPVEEKELHKPEIPFYKMASWIVRKLMKKKGKEAIRERKKIEISLMILFIGFLLLPLVDFVTVQRERPVPESTLDRPEKGEGAQDYRLEVTPEDETTKEEIVITMEERLLTDEEKSTFLENARDELKQTVLGENESADEVRNKIFLPSSLQDGRVTIYWIQEPQGLLEEDGTIIEDIPESGEVLILRALMNCDGMEETCEFALHLKPRIRSEEDEFIYGLRKAVEEAARESARKDKMVLPRQINGKKINWNYPESSMTGICIAGILILAVIGYVGISQEYKKEDEERERQLLLDYPDVVFKLGMLLNAGLTIQNAFIKVAEGYRGHMEQTKDKQRKRYAYEEMLYACNEMKSGVPEAKAYENFGRRCKETRYVRLGSILAGGLQKSAEGMTTLLLKEAEQAMEERRLLARKLGEEAGTKLLFPMLLMLVVVMVILMVPALLSF